MRIALWGMDPRTRATDQSWDEHWGMAHDPELYMTCDHAVEAHSPKMVEAICVKYPGHKDRLETVADVMPLYTPFDWPEKLGRHHVVTPYEWLEAPCIDSSVSYMLALAISRKPEAIGLFGVDMVNGEEYGYQRPNAAYLIGLARGKGIEVVLHPDSRLLASEWAAGNYGISYARVAAVVQDGAVEATA